MATVHSSKGGTYSRVALLDDLMPQSRSGGMNVLAERLARSQAVRSTRQHTARSLVANPAALLQVAAPGNESIDIVMIIYVALTRATRAVYIPPDLSRWIDAANLSEQFRFA